jgi:hypothetical protein
LIQRGLVDWSICLIAGRAADVVVDFVWRCVEGSGSHQDFTEEP